VSRANRKITDTWGVKIGARTKAGPGMMPPSPHPNPKSIDPAISGISICLLLETSKI